RFNEGGRLLDICLHDMPIPLRRASQMIARSTISFRDIPSRGFKRSSRSRVFIEHRKREAASKSEGFIDSVAEARRIANTGCLGALRVRHREAVRLTSILPASERKRLTPAFPLLADFARRIANDVRYDGQSRFGTRLPPRFRQFRLHIASTS